MTDMVLSERDEAIYAAWEGGKTLRVLARQFETTVIEVERALDRLLPAFDAQTNLRALKREVQQMEDLTRKFYEKAMAGDVDCAHLVARLNERSCSMRGITSLTIKLDPIAAQTDGQPTRFDKIHAAIMRVARGEQANGNGAALAPPTAPSTDDEDSENPSPSAREQDTYATWPKKPA